MVIELSAQKRIDFDIKFKEFEIKNSSIRALQVINDSTVWFAGSKGRYGRIINNKVQLDSIRFNGELLNFRSIAYNGKYIYLLSIENPAVLFKVNPNKKVLGKPEIVYQEDHANVFYDSMTFLDEKNGIAMGDPTANCFSVILTSDGGNTWKKLNCNKIPANIEGEAAFAASNGNIATYGKNVWMVSGGKKARVFYSKNRGKNWKVAETPVIQGGKMTGIYAVDFYDKNNGIIMGGNWEDKSSTSKTKAITTDGGKTWQLIANEQVPGYISSVQYLPDTNGDEIIAVSTEGVYYSNSKGSYWSKMSNKGFYSIRASNKNIIWFSGNNKIAKMQFQKK